MLPPGTLVSLGLVLVRVSAFVLASPLLGTGSSFSGYKVGLIGALSLLAFSTLDLPLDHSVGPLEFAAMAMREVLLGVVLASVLQAVMLAVRVAGEMIGHEMAFTMSSLVDPNTGVSTPLITSIHEGFFLLGLLALDGHHVLIRALSESFVRAPIGAVEFNSALSENVLILFSEMFASGLTFAAPVLVLLALVSLLIGLLARAVPQLNILEVGFTLRIGMGMIAMYGFAPLLAPALEGLFTALDQGLGGMLAAMEA